MLISNKKKLSIFDEFFRCPARARMVHVDNRVEITNLDHNHEVVIGRRSVGEAHKLKQAWKKERSKKKQKKEKEEKRESTPDNESSD